MNPKLTPRPTLASLLLSPRNTGSVVSLVDVVCTDVAGTDVGSDVAGLGSDVAGLGSDVAGLGSDVAGLGSDVAGLDSDVAGLGSDVTGLG